MNMDMIERGIREGKIQHVDELIKVVEKAKLGGTLYPVADGQGYVIQNEKVKWVITRAAHNPIIQAIIGGYLEQAKKQLDQEGLYWIDPKQTEIILSADSTQVFDMKEIVGTCEYTYEGYNLKLFFDDRQINSASGVNRLEQSRLAQRMGLDPKTRMRLERVFNSEYLSVILRLKEKQNFDPDFVRRWLEVEPGSLWYGSSIFVNSYESGHEKTSFTSIDQCDSLNDIIQGLHRNSPTSSGSEEKTGISQHYHKILTDPEEAVKAMDDKTAQGLLKIIADYKKSKR